MKIGVNIPNDGPAAARYGIVELAAAAEDRGADSLWVSDHLAMFESADADYPFSADGRPSWPLDDDYYEALLTLAAISSRTRRARLGTGVLVLPQRNILEVAKMTATLDQLSGGRLVLGVGAGWSRVEFEALGWSYPDRGGRMDEMITVLRSCWTGRPREFNGKHVQLPGNVILQPRPAQRAGPPILVGGTSPAALRRAGRYGDGWLGIAFARQWDPDRLVADLEFVRGHRANAKRTGGAWNVLKLHSGDGTWDTLAALIPEATAVGFDEVAVDLPWEQGPEVACALLATILAARDDTHSGHLKALRG